MKSDSGEMIIIEDKNSTESTFEYTYSATMQKEIEDIKRKYMPPQETQLEQLKRMDKEAERPGTIVSIMIGTIGILIFGTGMSFCLVWTDTLFVAGIVIGCIGAVMVTLAYPVYRKMTQKRREKIAPQILELCQRMGK